MKKSFLITLAAVSSVALIGCSSSSDDNNGGQGPEAKYSLDVTVAPYAKNSDWKASNVTLTVKKDDVATTEVLSDVKLDVACATALEDGEKVITADNSKIAIKSTKATEDNKCTVTVSGTVAGKAVSGTSNIDNADASYVDETPAEVVFTGAEDGFVLTKNAAAAAEAEDPNKVKFVFKEGKKAGKLTVDAAQNTIGTDGVAFNNSDISNPEFTVTGKANGVTVKYDAGTLTFDLTGANANITAEDNQAVKFTYDSDKNVISKPVTLTINGGTTPTPPAEATNLEAPVSVEDSYVASAATKVASIEVPTGVEDTVKLVCASDNTADATKVQDDKCLVDRQVFADNKIYFTVKSSVAKNFLAISEDGSAISNKALPTKAEFVHATTLAADNNKQVYISATRQSAPGTNAGAELTALANPAQIKITKTQNDFIFLELKSDTTKKLFEYKDGSDAGALTRTAVEPTKLAIEIIAKAGNVDIEAAASTNGGGVACADTQANAGTQPKASLCQVKIKNNAAIDSEGGVTLTINNKASGGKAELKLTGTANK